MVTKENAADTFVEFDSDTQENLIRAFSDTELRAVLDEIYVDDAADIIEEMPATLVKRILRNTDPETRIAINTILKYPEDSAGSIMTPEFVDLKKDMTVEDAFKRIRRQGVDKETIYTCYVTDAPATSSALQRLKSFSCTSMRTLSAILWKPTLFPLTRWRTRKTPQSLCQNTTSWRCPLLIWRTVWSASSPSMTLLTLSRKKIQRISRR
jgi:hypothetical protein